MTFKKGNPGGPGRPRGSRNKSALLLDEIGLKGASAALRRTVREAKGGNIYAADILLARTWPKRKGRPVRIELPPVHDAAGVAAAQAALISAVARGELTPDEGTAFASLLESRRRALETVEFEQRLEALEAAKAGNERRPVPGEVHGRRHDEVPIGAERD